MAVTANILVLSDEPTDKIQNCFEDENVALTKSAILDFDSLKDDIADFDLVLIQSGSNNLQGKADLLEGIANAEIPLLIVGDNPKASDIQSVPDNFCDLELRTRALSMIRLQTMKQEYDRRQNTTSYTGLWKRILVNPHLKRHKTPSFLWAIRMPSLVMSCFN
ncbi:hypothetical protein [Sneathiella glossodoripedis]|uniref:hypothetical protein n=1 Tax=Sneathiella glossodoripedis TaxID=418853 RepID=UPI00046FD154|nr:hypothetical protein [Sneathiella glossodoripedis]